MKKGITMALNDRFVTVEYVIPQSMQEEIA
jgi:hypothetical protein